jgi:hypothetical protein
MAFTFDENLPTAKDRIRLQLGDTSTADQLYPDETYLAYLERYDEPTTTALLARSLAAKFGRMPTSMSVPDGPSVSWSQRVSAWSDLAKSIETALGDTFGESAPMFETTLVRAGMNDGDGGEYWRDPYKFSDRAGFDGIYG